MDPGAYGLVVARLILAHERVAGFRRGASSGRRKRCRDGRQRGRDLAAEHVLAVESLSLGPIPMAYEPQSGSRRCRLPLGRCEVSVDLDAIARRSDPFAEKPVPVLVPLVAVHGSGITDLRLPKIDVAVHVDRGRTPRVAALHMPEVEVGVDAPVRTLHEGAHGREASEAALPAKNKRLLRKHGYTPRPTAAVGGGDGPHDVNHYRQLVLVEQARALYRYWPEGQERLFD